MAEGKKSRKFGRNARRPSTKAYQNTNRMQVNKRRRIAKADDARDDFRTPLHGMARDSRRVQKQIEYAKKHGLSITLSRYHTQTV